MGACGLVALAEQLEDADALAEIVVGLGRSSTGRMQASPQPQELSPGAAHAARLDPRRDRVEAVLRLGDPVQREQRLDADQIRLQRVDARHA